MEMNPFFFSNLDSGEHWRLIILRDLDGVTPQNTTQAVRVA